MYTAIFPIIMADPIHATHPEAAPRLLADILQEQNKYIKHTLRSTAAAVQAMQVFESMDASVRASIARTDLSGVDQELKTQITAMSEEYMINVKKCLRLLQHLNTAKARSVLESIKSTVV